MEEAKISKKAARVNMISWLILCFYYLLRLTGIYRLGREDDLVVSGILLAICIGSTIAMSVENKRNKEIEEDQKKQEAAADSSQESLQ